MDDAIVAPKYFRQLRGADLRFEPWMNTALCFKSRGARRSRMTGISPLSSNLGARVWVRSPAAPARSTFIVFSAAYLSARQHPCTEERLSA
jgi:hypothetical protein